jgi:uncharacterized protein
MKTSDLLNPRYLKVEIADTPSSHQNGLMYRTKLKDDGGMLFVFKRPQNLSFWGMNTYIPLDIAFVSEDNTIVKISHISPMDTKNFVISEEYCNRAIEANYGYFDRNKIKVGDKIEINSNEIETKVYFS